LAVQDRELAMILPFALDLIPERLGALLARVTKRRPEGQPILLRIDESGDPNFDGTVLSGKIHTVFEGIVARGPHGSSFDKRPYVVIELDSLLKYQNRSTRWVIVGPRFSGHGVYRLYLTWSVVHLFLTDGPVPPHELLWDNMIAISLLRFKKPR